MVETIKETKTEKLTTEDTEYVLNLHNDDFNTFQHVIKSLMEICGKTYEESEAIAYTVHNEQVCEVMTGKEDELMEKHMMFDIRGITSSVEKK